MWSVKTPDLGGLTYFFFMHVSKPKHEMSSVKRPVLVLLLLLPSSSVHEMICVVLLKQSSLSEATTQTSSQRQLEIQRQIRLSVYITTNLMSGC